MLVTRSSFDAALEELRVHAFLSLDTETTGLRPYHGDRIFSLILARAKPLNQARDLHDVAEAYYFNFWPSYPGFSADQVLSSDHWAKLAQVLFSDPARTWFIHKFNFDMHMLWAEGVELAGEVFCTLTQGRVAYNEHPSYDLDSSLRRLGMEKDDAVEKWITERGAWEWVQIPGKKIRSKNKFFYKAPPEVIIPYGERDAVGGMALGFHLKASITSQALGFPPGKRNLADASALEQRLAKTVFRMERVGVKIDRKYCERALAYEKDRHEKAAQAFKQETGREYSASPKLFAELFASERGKWGVTDKGNPSFESDTLKRFDHPAASQVLALRDAKSKLDFYSGFLWHADRDDVVHAQFTPAGARTFRFSSSEPNLQNLTSEEATFCRACKEWFEQYMDVCPDCEGTDLKHPEFMVRRAITPRPGFIFCLPDYDQMEYKMMLDYAKQMMIQEFKARNLPWTEDYFEVANKVRDGFDVHRATAELMHVPRKYAKTLNFLLIYGGRTVRLTCALLKPTLSEAALWAIYKDWKGFPKHRWTEVESKLFMEATYEQREHNLALLKQAEELINKYFKAVPYVEHMVKTITDVVKERGWLRNWAGYKYSFPDRGYAYTGPNTIIQGGCAAANKHAMNGIDDFLLGKKSRLVLTIHDELPTEVHESEIDTIPKKLVEIMESVYPHNYIPLTAGMEWSSKSLADKIKGYPV